MSFRKQKKQRIADRIERTGSADLVIGIDMAAGDDETIIQNFDQHGLVKTSFKDDFKLLKKLKTIEEKIEFKRDSLVPRYVEVALAMVEKNDVGDESLLFNVALWCLDIGDIENATKLVIFLLANDVETPHWFKTDAATFFAGEFVEWVSPKTKLGQSAQPYVDAWIKAYSELNEDQQDKLQILKHGALLVQAGKQAHLANQFDDAVALYQQADKINPRCGVKTVLKAAQEKKPLVIKPDTKSKTKAKK